MFYASELPAVDKICRTMSCELLLLEYHIWLISVASYKAFQEMPRFIVLNKGVSRDSSFRSISNMEEEHDYRKGSPDRWESMDG